MAGGEGTRLRPMTANQPKPLLPVVNRPIMEHVLRLLKRHGFDETVVTVQFLAALVRNYFGDGEEFGMNLQYATEEMPLGTAGSVRNAEDALRDEPFLVISGDALTDMDLTGLVRFHKEKGALVTVALAKVPNPLEFGIVITDEDGQIQRFLEKPTWGQVFSDTVNTGLYVMEPEVLAEVPPGEAVDWSGDVFPKLLKRGAPARVRRDRQQRRGQGGRLPAPRRGAQQRLRRPGRDPARLRDRQEHRRDAAGQDRGGRRRRGRVRDRARGLPVRRGEGLPVQDHRGGRGGQNPRGLGAQGTADPLRPPWRGPPGQRPGHPPAPRPA